MQVRWEEDAIIDLMELRDYIKRDNPNAAHRVITQILDSINLLIDHPLLGKVGRIHKTRELVVSGTPYTLIYLPESNIISILRIFHQSRCWDSFLKK